VCIVRGGEQGRAGKARSEEEELPELLAPRRRDLEEEEEEVEWVACWVVCDRSMSESAAGSESSSGGSVGKARNPATFTELLSRGGGIKRKRARVGKEQEEDIDSRIARLEAELANSASSSDSEGSEDEHDNNGELSAGSLEASEIVEKDGKLISALLVDKSARIQPLPPSMLPDPACGTRPPKGDVSSPPPDKKDGRNSQRPRVLSRPLQQTASGPKAQVQRGQGLEAAVRELQHTYEARSAERVPFYCRACKFQGSSVDDLAAHR
jgi:hypothetical protein